MPTTLGVRDLSDEELATEIATVKARQRAAFAEMPWGVWIYQKVRWMVRRPWAWEIEKWIRRL